MPLDNGIWRYTESDVAAPTFSEFLNRLGDSVRDQVVNRTGTFTPVSARVEPTGLYVRRRGGTVYLDGNLVIAAAGATAMAPGATWALATLETGFNPAFSGWAVSVPLPRGATGPGFITLTCATGGGLGVRNDSGASLTLAVGNSIAVHTSHLVN